MSEKPAIAIIAAELTRCPEARVPSATRPEPMTEKPTPSPNRTFSGPWKSEKPSSARAPNDENVANPGSSTTVWPRTFMSVITTATRDALRSAA